MTTSRRPIIAGNWKMNTTLETGVALARDVATATVSAAGRVDVLVIPPSTFIHPIAQAVSDAHVAVGGQNLHPAPGGAYTGELAGEMLAAVGCRYVVCGHSERRNSFGESAEFVGQKVAAAYRAGLTPILCVGELLEQREAGRTEAVVESQLMAGIGQIEAAQAASLVVAYEPVWAIGTGLTATPDQAQAVHAFLRRRLADTLGDALAEGIRIQYGGSVKPGNASELLAQPDIDGALVGGASLAADSFAAIVDAA